MRSLMQQTAFELKYEMLCECTRHRQRAAKADLERRGVAPRVRISSLYTPPHIAKHFCNCNIDGAR